MRLDQNETLDTLEETLKEMDEASRLMPVIVEGLKDRIALRSLGVNGNVVVLNDGTSILATCEKIAKQWTAAIIFTDWDQKGGELAHALAENLGALGISYDTEYRANVSMIAKKDIKDVEGLPALIRRLRILTGNPRPIF